MWPNTLLDLYFRSRNQNATLTDMAVDLPGGLRDFDNQGEQAGVVG